MLWEGIEYEKEIYGHGHYYENMKSKTFILINNILLGDGFYGEKRA